MMKAFVGTLACAGALMLAAPPVHAAPQGSTSTSTTTAEKKIDKRIDKSDKAVDERIEKRLKADRTLRRHDVGVSVEDGVAVLTGTVATRAQRARAERLAKAAGAVKVENRLEIGASADTTTGTAGKLERESRSGIGKTREGAEGVWDKTKEGAVTADIKTRFMADEALRASDIHVSTEGHVVTLTGTVPSEAARVKAVESARKVTGVDKVVDNLRVR